MGDCVETHNPMQNFTTIRLYLFAISQEAYVKTRIK